MYEESAMWIPKTELGKEVFENKITIEEIFRTGRKIKESQIIDRLLPDLRTDVVFIGGSPGKGGGSRRTPTRRTTRMHRSGRKYTISSVVIVGNGNGYIGIGKAKAKDHKKAIEKATKAAKLNVIPVKRGCGSWECKCNGQHSIPFTIEGSAGSVRVMLKPAPKGIGLCIGDEAKKLLQLAGIKDIWSKVFGESRSRVNYMYALFDAFRQINKTKSMENDEECDKEEKKSKKPHKKKESKKNDDEKSSDSSEEETENNVTEDTGVSEAIEEEVI